MDWQYTPYTFPLLITGGISLAIGAYIVHRRHVPGASNLLAMVLGISIWIFAYSLELSTVHLETKLFWASVEYIGIVYTPVTFALFILKYIGDYQQIKQQRRFILGLAIIPTITLLLVWTNEWHSLIWPTTEILVDQGITYLSLTHGFWYWIFITYVYMLLGTSSYLLLRKIMTSPGQFQGQIILIILSCISPWLGSVLYITDINPFPHLDPTPFTFVISTLCFVWALFRFKLLDIVPVARGLVIEKLEAGVIVIDEKNRVVDINATAVDLLKQAKNKLLGQPIPLSHPNWKPLSDALNEGQAANLELYVDQVYYEVSITLLHRKKEGANGRIITLHNITKRKETELLLLQAKQAAESADQAKTNFLTNMSHEIRTPLNAVVGMAEMLRQTQLNTNQLEMIDVVAKSSDSLLSLLNNILDYAQLEAHNLTLNQQAFDLVDCIESSIDNVKPLAHSKLIELAYKIEENTPTSLLGDPVRLRQILVNLLENGVKFTEEGTVSLFVQHNSEATRSQLQFTIQDRGVGIAPDHLPHLFSPFHQVDSSMTRSHGGNGLGLAICKQLVTLMGGTISLDSTVGQGTAVHFTALFDLALDAKQPAVTLRQYKTTLANKRLMVITKDATQRRQISREARMAGLEVYAAASSQEASYWIDHTQSFDIALLDSAVWREEPAILTRLQHKDTALPLPTVLLVPPNANGPTIANGSAKFFSGYLPSPIISSQMQDTLLNVLATSGTQGALPDQGNTMADRYPLKILIVEDNKLNQRVLQNMLAKLGFTADVAANGKHAVAAAKQKPYDVILMDIQMPVMDGVEATQHILNDNSWNKRPYIIAITAHALEGDREYYLTSGMNEYVSKPITLNQLVEVLYQAISIQNEATPEPRPLPQSEEQAASSAEQEHDLLDDPIDLAELACLVGEDIDGFLTMMAPIFLEDTQEILQKLVTAVHQNNSQAVQQAAHTLKGTSASMAMTHLAQLSRELETVSKAGDLTHVAQKLEQLQIEYGRVAETLVRMGYSTN